MKLNDYIKLLNQYKEKYGDLEVVYAQDEEGNAFERVFFAPTLGKFDRCQFIAENEFDYFKIDKKDINSICIN